MQPSISSVVADLLVLFLVVVGPIWDYFETRSLKAHSSGQARLHYYRKTVAWLWLAAAIACWAEGFRRLVTLRGLGIHAVWLHQHRWAWWLLVILAVLAVLVQPVLPLLQVSLRYRKRPFSEPKQLQPLRFFLPASRAERRWFAALGVSAGFCEELLFRGFLLRYLHTSPLHLALVWAALIAALVFGAHHLYHGRGGVVSAVLGGLVFTAILLVTGSLWVGMAYHAAIDVSLLAYWRPRPRELATA